MSRRTVPAAAAVALALVAAGCGGSTSSSTGTATVVGPMVVITNFAFAPKTLTVKAGTTVTWRNDDVAVHDIKFSSAIRLSPLLTAKSSQSSWSHTFTAPGTYAYICGIHPFMTGTVTVTP